jgi:hypothetical protein
MSGFSFNLRTEYEQGPLSIRMIEEALKWGEIESADIAPVIAEKILALVIDGATAREFRKWCESENAPEPVRELSKEWTELIFSSVAGHIYSAHKRIEFEKMNDTFPLWQIDSMTRFCRAHHSLDGLIAKPDDPIWQKIYPPNGWLCGCGVSPMLEDDGEITPGAVGAIPKEVIDGCVDWINQFPEEAFDLL